MKKEEEFIKRVLPSGLTVILAPMEGTKTITAVVAVGAGWKYETLDIHGLSHFLEHMAFKGTVRRPKTIDIAKEIDGIGGIMNAFTSEEMTGYFIKAASEHAPLVLDVISDMLLHSLLEPVEIERESGTIIEELRMYNDDPQWYAGGILWPRLLYGDQPAGRLCIGTEESIKSLRRHHFLEYMRKLYVASNMVVCLAGHIPDANKAYLDIAQNFGLVSRDSVSLFKPPVVENQVEPALLLVPRPLEQSSILLGVRAYRLGHPDYYVLGMIKSLLGGGMSSRMFTEVREKRGLAYAVYTHLDAQTDVGNFCTIAGLKREKIAEGLRVILDQYGELAAGRVTEEELVRTKSYIRGARRIKAEQSQNIAMDLASKFIIIGETQSSEDEMEKIEAVTLADIERVARNIFVNQKLNLVVVGPHDGMEEEFLKILKF